ncbi:hypothetical protein J2R96_002059 [Bradyrhizobium elkanii]|nr:hypothetical protein [Bradyrhizobium elkanii]
MMDVVVTYVAGIMPDILMWRSDSGPRRMDEALINTGRRDEPDQVALGLPKQA